MPSPSAFRDLRTQMIRSIEADRAELVVLRTTLRAFQSVPSYYRDASTAKAVVILKGRITKEEKEIVEKQELVRIIREHQRYFEAVGIMG